MVALISIPALIALIVKVVLLIYSVRAPNKNAIGYLYLSLLVILALVNLVEFLSLNYYSEYGLTPFAQYLGFGYIAFIILAFGIFFHLCLSIGVDDPSLPVRPWLMVLLYIPAAALEYLLLFTDKLVLGFKPFHNTVLRDPGPWYLGFETFTMSCIFIGFVILIYGARSTRPALARMRSRLWLLGVAPVSFLSGYLIVGNHFGWAKLTSTIYIPIAWTFLLLVTTYATHEHPRPGGFYRFLYHLFDIEAFLPWSKLRRNKTALYKRIQSTIDELTKLRSGEEIVQRVSETLDCPVALIAGSQSAPITLGNATGMALFPQDQLRQIDQILVVHEIARRLPETHALMRQHRIALIVPFHCHSPTAASWMLLGEPFSERIYTPLDFRLVEQLFDRIGGSIPEILLQVRTRELSQARDIAVSASERKSQFFASASHDLRQPLHALLLLMGSLQVNLTQKEAQPTLVQMQAVLGSLESMFDDILNINRLESGTLTVDIGPVSTVSLFESLEREFKPLTDAKGLRLTFRAPNITLETDYLFLERILRNLIANAIKYTDRGGILVTCRTVKKDKAVKIQVIDTGVGIAENELASIFEDFYRIVRSTGRGFGQRDGVGLGLGIVRRLANSLNHPIEVRSQPDRGSVFTLRVPVSEKESASSMRKAVSNDALYLPLAGRSILVVDDREMAINAISTLLLNWDARVLTATSSTELQHVLATVTTAPDFLIVDYQFEPSFTGEDVIRHVREHFHTLVPSAMMTGNVTLVPPHVSQLPRVSVFAKPVSPAKLRALLHFNLVLS